MIQRLCLLCAFICCMAAADRPVAGFFDAACRGAGPGHVRWFDGLPPVDAEAAWTLSCWVKPATIPTVPTLIAGFGAGINMEGAQRFLGIFPKGLQFWGGNVDVPAGVTLTAGRWQHCAVTWDGMRVRIYVDGRETASRFVRLTRAAAQVLVAPPPPWKDGACFAGVVARLGVWDRCLAAAVIADQARASADLDAIVCDPAPAGATPDRVGPYAPRKGMIAEQDPATHPGPVPAWEAKRLPRLAPRPAPQPATDGTLCLDRGWELADATGLATPAAAIAMADFDSASWYDATVPGTVLTTLVQQGIHPDPLHGLNNLVIPDELSRRNWWYRTTFATPAAWDGRAVQLIFHGINYHAEVWLNGKALGTVTGAFIRGVFDATPALAPAGGVNALAVRIRPQPHGGAAQEESQLAGPGPNGGDGCLDGPTFFCTEGWDWIPTIRDRCTGIWQDVELRPVGGLTLGDPKLVTTLPLPDRSRADVTIDVLVRNRGNAAQKGVVIVSLCGAEARVPVEVSAGTERTITVSPATHAAFSILNPRLWWPNGHGEPTLHDLVITVDDGSGRPADRLRQRVGLRTLSWTFAPHLTLAVNGEKVFCRGGNWGLDDALKRVSRERLEPYIRLHRDAHLTMIRNWCGQNTEEVFFQLCDEYGILVWNDFWLTTKGHNLPAIDTELWMANATDTVRRIRNHPSVAVWCARNEGEPPPWIAGPLDRMLAAEDGTRPYEPSSNSGPRVMNSGPWDYRAPQWYDERAKGFLTEIGVNSVPTADAMRAMMPAADTWPLSNDWTYHDLHAVKHGPVGAYLEAIATGYGNSTGLDGFCRRAQMVNYVNHRAMLEAFLDRMWQPTSGMLLWMTHPAWPSTVWQLYTQDYETHAAFWAMRKASEPTHVQWSLRDGAIAVVNHRGAPIAGATVTAVIHGLDGARLSERSEKVEVAASATTRLKPIIWPAAEASPVCFLKLELKDAAGALLSENFYWRSEQHEDQRLLQRLPPVQLDASVVWERRAGQMTATVQLANPGRTVALMTHLVLRNAAGARILPAYASDNYVSFLPGERRTVTITGAEGAMAGGPQITLDGWNVVPASVR